MEIENNNWDQILRKTLEYKYLPNNIKFEEILYNKIQV